MLICGQIAALKRVADLLQKLEDTRLNGRLVVNALFSALILREEAKRMEIPVSGTRATEVDAAWQNTVKVLERIEPYQDEERLWAAQAFALSQHLRDEPLTMAPQGTNGLEKAFREEVDRACYVFKEIDRKWARRLAETRLAQLSHMLPERDRTILDTYVLAQEKMGRNLADFYAAAMSEDDLVKSFQCHAKMSPEAATVTLISHLIRQIDSDEDRYKFAALLQRHLPLLASISSTSRSRGHYRLRQASRFSALAALDTSLCVLERETSNKDEGIGPNFGHIDLMFANLAPIDSSRSKFGHVEMGFGGASSQSSYLF